MFPLSFPLSSNTPPFGSHDSRTDLFLSEKRDGTATTYSNGMVDGKLVMTTRSGAGNCGGITDNTEVTTTHGHLGNTPHAQSQVFVPS